MTQLTLDFYRSEVCQGMMAATFCPDKQEKM